MDCRQSEWYVVRRRQHDERQCRCHNGANPTGTHKVTFVNRTTDPYSTVEIIVSEGMYTLPGIEGIFETPSGSTFDDWEVPIDGSWQYFAPGEQISVTEDIEINATPITSVTIDDLTKPVVGDMPDNDITVSGTGVTVDEDGSYWGRFVSPQFSPYYSDGTTAVDSVAFRDGEIYLLQITIQPKPGFSFTADTKILYGGTELSAPDAANPTASCAALAPDGSMAMALIHPNGTSVPLTYTVSFDANGGTGTMTDVTGISGEYELPACTFYCTFGQAV